MISRQSPGKSHNVRAVRTRNGCPWGTIKCSLHSENMGRLFEVAMNAPYKLKSRHHSLKGTVRPRRGEKKWSILVGKGRSINWGGGTRGDAVCCPRSSGGAQLRKRTFVSRPKLQKSEFRSYGNHMDLTSITFVFFIGRFILKGPVDVAGR